MPINVQIDDLFGRKAKQRRQGEAATLAQQLLERGADPTTANMVAAKYLKTGQFEVPTESTKMLPAIDETGPRSTRVPFSLKKKKAFYGYNTKSGKLDMLDTGEDVDDVSIRSYTPADEDDGYDIYVDHLGNEVRRERNNGRQNKVIKLAKPGSPGGGSGMAPQQRAAHDTHKRYLAAIQKGQVPSDLAAEMESAAPLLGMTLEDIQGEVKKPGIFKRAGAALTGKTLPEEREPGYKLPVFRTPQAATAPVGGRDEYQQDLRDLDRAIKAGIPADKAKARFRKKWPKGRPQG